jgi:hypothetical protein
LERYKAPEKKKSKNSSKNLGLVITQRSLRTKTKTKTKMITKRCGVQSDIGMHFFMDDAYSDEHGMSTATTWPYKDHATHVFTEVAASPRLFILGGVENGRGGSSSLTPKMGGGAHPRVATVYMSGISSGTGGLSWSVLASCICTGGKCEARGVEV